MEKSKERIKNMTCGESGITLIALIVTIIIMLILASVTISLSFGEGGLFSKAHEAVKKYSEAEEIEKIGTAYTLALSDNNMEMPAKEQLQEILVNDYNFDVTVVQSDMYFDDNHNTYYLKSQELESVANNSRGEECSVNTITKTFTLQGKENFTIHSDTFLIVAFNREFKWYCIDSSGVVRIWRPSPNIGWLKTTIANSKDAFLIEGVSLYRTSNYTSLKVGILVANNARLGADTSIPNCANTKLFSYDYLDNYMKFSDDTYTMTSTQPQVYVGFSNDTSYVNYIQKLTYTINTYHDRYYAIRAFMVLENNYTHETKAFYGEPVYVTYNEVLALEQ